MPVILALERPSQEDDEFKANLSYIETLSQKPPNQNRIRQKTQTKTKLPSNNLKK
jgi:hypothetical protein